MQQKIEKGDKLKCIFSGILPGNEYGPPVIPGNEYTALDVFTDPRGFDHIDVGLLTGGPNGPAFVTSYQGKDKLPGKQYWCHPNRFIIL